MKRLDTLRVGLLCCATAVAGSANAQQADFSKVEYTTVRITDSLFMLSTPVGGNVGVSIGADGVVLIDDQYAELTPKLRAAVALLSDKPVRFLINTHWHGDHTGGNAAFGTQGAVILAQGNVRKRMSSVQVGSLSGRQTPPSPAAGWPVVSFDESVSLHLNGDDLSIFHVPAAHTDGDAIVMFRQANVVHMGDTFFVGSYPFVDNNSGGTYDGMISAVDGMLSRVDDNTRIIPGHGPLAGKKELQQFRDMMVTVRGRVQKLIKAGKTQDEVIAAKPTADYDAQWAGGFWKPEQWVARVYIDLKRNEPLKRNEALKRSKAQRRPVGD